MKILTRLLAVVMIAAIGFLLGRYGTRSIASGIDGVVKTDTLIFRDTFTFDRPVYITKIELDTMFVPVLDTIRIRDTVYIALTREQKYYEDKDYEAWVSGFKPELDSIKVFPVSKYIMTEKVAKNKPKRWGIGVQAGYGICVRGRSVVTSPYIGVGISYDIFQF